MKNGLEINFGNVPLATKLDVIGALLAAVQEAHRDTCKTACWAAMTQARERVAEATMHASERPKITSCSGHPDGGTLPA